MEENEIVQGAEAQEVTEPASTETQPVNQAEVSTEQNAEQVSGNEQTEAATADTKTEEDSRFANVRRKAEEDARARYEAKERELNERYKAMFAGFTNPQTGKPIETADDYLIALQAQQRAAQEAQLRANGVDPQIIEQMINNSPVVRQANEMIQQNQRAEAERKYAEDLKAVMEIDPTIKSEADLMAHPSYQTIYKLVSENNLSLPDAYKLANYSALSAKNNAAAKQAAINQVKGKNHMEATESGRTNNDELADVPASTMAAYRMGYPGLTDHEIQVKYNEFLKMTGGK